MNVNGQSEEERVNDSATISVGSGAPFKVSELISSVASFHPSRFRSKRNNIP